MINGSDEKMDDQNLRDPAMTRYRCDHHRKNVVQNRAPETNIKKAAENRTNKTKRKGSSEPTPVFQVCIPLLVSGRVERS